MKANGIHRRIARLTHEADQSPGPALVLLAATLMLLTVLGLNVLADAWAPSSDDDGVLAASPWQARA